MRNLKNKETKNIIEETNQGFIEDAFKSVIPDFSFSVNGTQVVIRVKPVVGADGYEVYQSEKKSGGYSKAAEASSPVVDFYVPDGK